jgi:hypothetical protein
LRGKEGEGGDEVRRARKEDRKQGKEGDKEEVDMRERRRTETRGEGEDWV